MQSVDGKFPQVHADAFVSEAAYLIGDVEVCELASIWPGTVVRADSGYIKIGARANIQDNSVVHADADAEIGEGVTIGHRVVCHGRNIGAGSLLGNGSVINDGVVLGEMCLIAAGSVVVENLVAPPFSILRGSPAKIIGSLRQRHKLLLINAAEKYVERIPRYRHTDFRNKL